MATRSLSPKRAAERMRQHRHAVMVLAMQSATKAIKLQLRAQGIKLSQVPPRTIRIFADAYFDVHRANLIAEAKHTIETWPGFARWRLPPGHEVFVKSHNYEHSTNVNSRS